MKRTLVITTAVICVWLTTLSAHVVRGILNPTQATAFVSSPSATEDVPIPVKWAAEDSGLRIACFNIANTSPASASVPGWPRVTAFGFELAGARSGFALLNGQNEWQVLEGISASLPGRGNVILDVVIAARGSGIAPGQAATRGAGTKLCLSGPFPDGPSIEQLINGVAVGFQSQPGGPIVDIGLWDSPQRVVPLHP
jgi:hypothetical protein